MDTQALLTAIAGGAILVLPIQGLVKVLKGMLPAMPGNYVPGVSLLVGILVNLGWGAVTGEWWPVSVIVGMFAGLAASGLYDYGAGKPGQPEPPRG